MRSEAVTDKQLELLSVYADGQCSPQEIAEVESLLQSVPESREILEEIQLTQQVLRQARMYKAPRNYALTPEMANQRAGWNWGIFFRATSAVTAMFAFVFAIMQLNPLAFRAAAPQVAMEAAVPQAETYSAVPDASLAGKQASEEISPIVVWNNSPAPASTYGSRDMITTGMGGGGGPSETQGLVSMAPSEYGTTFGSITTGQAQTGMGGGAGGSSVPAAEERGFFSAPKPNTNIDLQIASADDGLLGAPQMKVEGSGPILGIQPSASQGSFTVGPIVQSPTTSQSDRLVAGLPLYIMLALSLMAVSFGLLISSFFVAKR